MVKLKPKAKKAPKAKAEKSEKKGEKSETAEGPDVPDVELRATKDCLYGDDASHLLSKASLSLSSRGHSVDKECPLVCQSFFRKTLHLLWGEAVEVDSQETKKWPLLKKALFIWV